MGVLHTVKCSIDAFLENTKPSFFNFKTDFKDEKDLFEMIISR